MEVQLDIGPLSASAWLLTMISPAQEDGDVALWRIRFRDSSAEAKEC